MGQQTALDPSFEDRERLQRRDSASLEWFYSTYFDRIYGYVRRLLRDDHLAEDVTQDIFMHIHRSLPSYDPQRQLRPWVFTIATNKVRDFWRSRRHKDGQREVSVEDQEDSYAESAHQGPVEELESGEMSTIVGAAIESLPEGMRQTLILRYFEDLSFAEIGKIIDRNEAAVRKRYSRALSELRKFLCAVPGFEFSSSPLGSDGGDA
ncbi:MAG: RNA polymerase sigma-70 factor (ECF subfamily) [Planctomycetota bacterium]|jgi:RNA polymerase sigma-70 factor (ECF subfamily)